MQNDKKELADTPDYSLYLSNMQEFVKNEKKCMIFLIIVLK